MTEPRTFRILYIEDSPPDTEFLLNAFRKKAPEIQVAVAASGQEGLARLGPKTPSAELPDLILLDLKMPGMDGHEVLSALKRESRLRQIPVVVLTSSRLEEDISRAYAAGASCYLPKPDDALGYANIAEEIRRFWGEISLLPRRGPA